LFTDFFYVNLDNNHFLIKSEPSKFTEAEIEQLKQGVKRTYKERFEMATRLYKIQQTMSKATITHKPFINK